MMELPVYISKKGTKVVRAMELHRALGLSNDQYPKNLRRWLREVYEFHDGIRKAEHMRDYARRPKGDSVLEDYYLSLEMAKLVCLASRSKEKLKYAKWLSSMDSPEEKEVLFSKEQILAVLELSKAFGLVSCQQACEQKHLETYEQRNGGQAANWWQFRAKLLGYSGDDLKARAEARGKSSRGKSRRRLLMEIDQYEMIRTAAIDLFMAMGKPEPYAAQMGDLAKRFAQEMKVDIVDDRTDMPLLFQPAANPEVVGEIVNNQAGRYLSLWKMAV